SSMFLLTYTSPTSLSALSLHDALAIFCVGLCLVRFVEAFARAAARALTPCAPFLWETTIPSEHPTVDSLPPGQMRAGRRVAPSEDRKSTRLNSSHLGISYAVFCLKKKT